MKKLNNHLIKFTVPGQPQGKGRARASTIAGRITLRTPERTVLYENWTRSSVCAVLPEGYKPTDKQLLARVDMYYKIPKSGTKKVQAGRLDGSIRPTIKPDIDNVLKAIFDSLNGIVYKDDSQIVMVMATKFYSDNPRVEVTFTEDEEWGKL